MSDLGYTHHQYRGFNILVTRLLFSYMAEITIHDCVIGDFSGFESSEACVLHCEAFIDSEYGECDD